MPYITEKRRERVEAGDGPATVGELNYQITCDCMSYMLSAGIEPSYSAMNEIIGVLECVKQEFYRRVLIPHEEEKIKQNGDVY